MKVAIVTDSFHPTRDGVVTSIDVMRSIFDANGIESVVIAPDPGRPEDRIDGVQYFRSVKFRSYEGYFVPIFPSNKVQVIQEINPDVVHIQGVALMALKGIVAAHHLKIPVIMTFHTMVGDTMKYYSPVKIPQASADKLVWKYIKYLSKWVDIIIAPTPSIEKEIREHGIKKEIRVISTPIDTSRFTPDTDHSEIAKKYNLEGKKVIISVGRVSFEKNIDVLVRALKELDDGVVLFIVGSGPAMDSIKQLSEELGLKDRVIFAGYVPYEDIAPYYTAADVAATASRFETQGLTAIEAMSCGLPVVCANERAFRDYVEDGKNGYLFDNTVEDCVTKLRLALDAPDEMKHNAMQTASTFSPDVFITELTKLYNDAIEKKRCKRR